MGRDDGAMRGWETRRAHQKESKEELDRLRAHFEAHFKPLVETLRFNHPVNFRSEFEARLGWLDADVRVMVLSAFDACLDVVEVKP